MEWSSEEDHECCSIKLRSVVLFGGCQGSSKRPAEIVSLTKACEAAARESEGNTVRGRISVSETIRLAA